MLRRLTESLEAASRRYIEAHGIIRDPDRYLLKLHEEVSELTQIWNRIRGRTKGRTPDDLAQDLAE